MTALPDDVLAIGDPREAAGDDAYRGGQGRSDESIEREAVGWVEFWAWLGCAAFALSVGLWVAGQMGGGA